MSNKTYKQVRRLFTIGMIATAMTVVGMQPVDAAPCCRNSGSRGCVCVV